MTRNLRTGLIGCLVLIFAFPFILYAATNVFYNVRLRGSSPYQDYGYFRYSGGAAVSFYDSSGDTTFDLGNELAVNVPATIGDGSANYAAFAADGEITLHGTARVTKSVDIMPNQIAVQAATPAALVDHGIGNAWQFADAATTMVICSLVVPRDMDVTVGPGVSILWSSTTVDPGDNTKQALWQIEYLYLAAAEDTTAVAQDTISALYSASTVAEGLVESSIAGMQSTGTADILCLIRISRLGGDVTDTLGDTAEMEGIRFTYTSNSLGDAT